MTLAQRYNPPTMRLAIWDFDGTLAERPGLWSQCLADLANRHTGQASQRREDFVPHLKTGFPWHTPERAHTEIRTADEWWTALHPTLETAFKAGGGFSSTEAAGLARAVRDEYTRPTHWRVFPDTTATLSLLKARGWRHVLLSNHVPELAKLVEALGLSPFFDAIHTSALSGHEKPHPLAFLNAIPDGVDIQHTVMIGDSQEADVEGAEALGIRAFLVRKPNPRCEGQVSQLMHIAEALDDPKPV